MIRLTAAESPPTIEGVSTSNEPHREYAVRSLADHFPGWRFLAPMPSAVVRPTAGPGRLCAYHTTVTAIPIHFHPMAELTLIRGGSGTVRIAGRQHSVGPGVLAFAPPNVLHGHRGEQPVDKSVCMFDMGLVDPLLVGDPVGAQLNAVGSDLPAAVRLDPDTAAAVGRLFDTILVERERAAELGGGVMTASLILQVLVTFLRQAAAAGTTAGGENDSGPELGTPDDELTRVLNYLQEHFTRPINRATVARALGMRPEAVSRVFSQTQGTTFSNFLQHLRVGHAVELLQGTTLSATDIGRLSGFDSYRTFARAFTATFNLSPGAYRAEQRSDDAQRPVR